ncbi:MAG: MBL fold metallo-hydrolase [Spirochaetota bacterium]|nr:MBL fold metallo-hydrolase [Spirochaetota bacterium]
MEKQNYSKGIHKIGKDIYAYLQPDGGWGWSNAGLIVDNDVSLLVDTLFDLDLTREMLREMRRVTKAADRIDTLIITHANGDHFYGNELVKNAEIISSKACAEEMVETPPQVLAEIAKEASNMGELGEFFLRCFKPFNFEGITMTPPTRTFERRLNLSIIDKEVILIEVGPCHTRGDVIVYIPDDKTIFAGDILFIGGTPIMWSGPVANWIRACDMMLDMDVEFIVPGHGPITNKRGVESVREYWEYVETEARMRYDNGMSAVEAAMDIDLGKYASWGEKERIVVNVATLYREFGSDDSSLNVVELFSLMAKMMKD